MTPNPPPIPEPDLARLRALAAYLPVFEAPGFAFGSWVEVKPNEPGVLNMSWYDLSEPAAAFEHMAYDTGWVLLDFDWPNWKQTSEALQLRDDPQVMARATALQLAKVLTVCIRQDRFADGELEAAFNSGLLTAVCRRAAQLVAEAEAATGGQP